ncbi:MAG TPA: hypothetical protein VGQ42_06350 [Candidatus Dormibacteraeota bacterium]|jgi:hypothetical protein|nr:hypothetical protein [Candidatus Dormibacteraeota bacterium]
MRTRPTLIAAGAIAALAATACGSGTSIATHANVLQGKSPDQIIKLASSAAATSSYRMGLHGVVSVDVSGVQGLPPAAAQHIAGTLKGLTLDGKGDVQDAKHARITMTLKPVVDKQLVVVLYGDKVYVSEDGGKTFADGGSFSLQGLPLTPDDLVTELNATGQIQDMGTTTRNGNEVKHLHAVLTNDYFQSLLNKVGGSGAADPSAQQFGALIGQMLTVKDGSVDAYVRTADGKLDSSDSKFTIAIDIGKLMNLMLHALGSMTPAPDSSTGATPEIPNISGSMNLSLNAGATFSDYGAKIAITQPTVDPNAPVPSTNLFGA